MKGKLFSALLALLMLFALVPTAFAEDEITIIDPAEEGEEPALIVLAEPNAAVTITVQPEDAAVPQGGTAVFHVEAVAGGGETISYRWQYYCPGAAWGWLSSGTNTGEKTDTYRIHASGYRNGYRYRCQILVNGVVCATSREATLTVLDNPGRPVIVGPGWGERAAVSAELNETAVFQVTATGENLKYQWQYRPYDGHDDYNSGWSNCSGEDAGTPDLHIRALLYRNRYAYRCRVYNDNSFTYSGTYILTIGTLPAPPIILRSGGTVSRESGEWAELSCSASGESLSFQWYFRKNSEDVWSRCTVATAKDRTMTIQAFNYRSGYQYRCRVYNDGGSKYTEMYTLEVLPQEPPVIVRQPRDTTEGLWNTAYFFVEASGTNLRYQWQFQSPGSSVWSNSSSETAYGRIKGVAAIARRDGQRYRCKVYNAAGSVYTEPATLNVVDQRPITVIRHPQSVTANRSAQLTVEAEGVREYIWCTRRPGSDEWTELESYVSDCRPWLDVLGMSPGTNEYCCKLIQGDTVVYTEAASVTFTFGGTGN